MGKLVRVRLWDESGPECECEWPEGLPRDFNDLFKYENAYILKKIQVYNQVQRNLEDLVQDIWMKLIQSNLLVKFVERTARQLPETIRADEAAGLLGITLYQLQVALYYRSHVGLSFEPCNGTIEMDHTTGLGRIQARTLFLTADIQALDRKYPKYDQDARTEPRRFIWRLQSTGFRPYLTQAIHNHFANWCRTRFRKYKEMLLAGTSILKSGSDGSYTSSGHNAEAVDWESRLVAMTMNDEDFVSVVETVQDEFSSAGIDPQSLTETESYTESYTDEAGQLCSRVRQRPTAAAMRSLELLDTVMDGRVSHPDPDRKPKSHRGVRQEARHETTNFGDGRTIREAVRMQARADIRARTRITATG